MAYANKVAETAPKENLKNPPDAKPDDWRNPWKGAAIGGTLGGLVTTALGYLYGHRGRWLAYDAIAGGGTGAAIGYGVDAHNNAKAEEKNKPNNRFNPQSKQGSRVRNRLNTEELVAGHADRHREWNKIQSEGGFDINPFSAGPARAAANLRRKLALMANGAHVKDPQKALEIRKRNKATEDMLLGSSLLNPFVAGINLTNRAARKIIGYDTTAI